MKEKVDIVYEKFTEKRRVEEIEKANNENLIELEELEKMIKI
jgi:hypothetical protein